MGETSGQSRERAGGMDGEGVLRRRRRWKHVMPARGMHCRIVYRSHGPRLLLDICRDQG
jgi:hypothetical protein